MHPRIAAAASTVALQSHLTKRNGCGRGGPLTPYSFFSLYVSLAEPEDGLSAAETAAAAAACAFSSVTSAACCSRCTSLPENL